MKYKLAFLALLGILSICSPAALINLQIDSTTKFLAEPDIRLTGGVTASSVSTDSLYANTYPYENIQVGSSLYVTGSYIELEGQLRTSSLLDYGFQINYDTLEVYGVATFRDDVELLLYATTARVGGTVYTSETTSSNIGTGEDTLATYTLNGSTIQGPGDKLIVTASFTFANNGNSKRLRAYYGATAYFDVTIPAGALEGDFHAVITRTGTANNQKAISTITLSGGNYPKVQHTTLSINESSSNVIKFTGEGVSNNDLNQQTFAIDYKRGTN